MKKCIKHKPMLCLIGAVLFSWEAAASKEFVMFSLDGGGTRGASVHIEILRQMEEATGKKIQDLVHMFVGTSIGFDLALALAMGNSVHDCYDFIVKRAPDVLDSSYYRKIIGTGGIFSYRYDTEPLYDGYMDFYGEESLLSDITSHYVLGTTWNLETEQPELIANWDLNAKIPTVPGFPAEDMLVWHAAAKTSAAPTYWPPFEGKWDDGGVWANNPSAVGLNNVNNLMRRGVANGLIDTDGEGLRVKIYSLGTGTVGGQHPVKHLLSEGVIHQVVQIVNIATGVKCVEMNMETRMGKDSPQYFRFKPELTEEVRLDCNDVKVLDRVADETEKSLVEWDRWDEMKTSLQVRDKLWDEEVIPLRSTGSREKEGDGVL